MGALSGGAPTHTRACTVEVARTAEGIVAQGSLIDLRTRGFLPVGASVQGMGIIHHMEQRWRVDLETMTVADFAPSMPTVAFESTLETEGESCRDRIARASTMNGKPLGRRFGRSLREAMGGPNGCSHVITLALFMDGGVRAGLELDRRLHPGRLDEPGPDTTLFRRDAVFTTGEDADGRTEVEMRFGDLHWSTAEPGALPPDRLARHHEIDASMRADLWPGELLAITGRERVRTRSDFAGVAWQDRTELLRPLTGMGLAKGAAGTIMEGLGDAPEALPWVDALLMLAPTLVQCRAAHPDRWHDKVMTTDKHPGLTAIPDSCYMWRRGGALERLRERHGAGKGGR